MDADHRNHVTAGIIAEKFWRHIEKFGIKRTVIPYKGWPELDTEKELEQFRLNVIAAWEQDKLEGMGE